ncbi:MAG: DEAD/DEAH box helicase family protein [Dorea sp.]|nr:DEAD/DEAH box helicase family protein [Dorea sp.]
MKIELFEHNQTAYQAALDMLQTAGKAAVVHPTGTGKSFIGFKLCEDFPDKIICWLSPSEYIFKTQVENLAASGAFHGDDQTVSGDQERPVLKNVKFYTYAKLMTMTEEELGEISPDYIILDEFHRCGAKVWGQGVEKLLALYLDAPVLGLSATAIRYLDNQRDMSDELFDGNVASEMTLGEAIVRGILNPPKYVLSVFSYQKDLAKYQKRLRMAKNKAVRDEGERQLDALRHALQKADGLDEIFRKHMKNPAGKYIVFCANYEHMTEMIGKAPEWFAKVDRSPHIYTAYSEDPAASQAFADFKADGSGRLKLLYCIDMLNEGVHVEDVEGVILLRPTVSPIIYKQQIGRALSASKKKDAVIFDIVLNIENLHSIGTIEEEMQIAASYYHYMNREEEIVNEHFKVVDEVRDCVALFERLNETLTASWDLMYECARQYYQENGNLEVPVRYRTEDGYGLGQWILTQRRVRAGEKYGVLGEDRIRKLNRIGMVWGSYRDLSWERYYKEAKDYYEKYGDLNTNVNTRTDSGIRLGSWICQLRTYRKSGIQRGYLTEERVKALDEIGMIWDVPDYLWEENYAECLRYYREHGNLNIPNAYCSPKGLKIGGWIRRQRLLRRGSRSDGGDGIIGENGGGTGAGLTKEQIARLDSIGMVWKTKPEQQWEKGCAEASAYYKEHGNLNVPAGYVSPTGYKLGSWIADRREKGREKHSLERQRQLDEIGMVWVKPDSWEVRYELARAYYEEHGNLNIPSKYRAEGIWLAKWVNEQKQIFAGKRKGKALREDQVRRLEMIGMEWERRKKDGRNQESRDYNETLKNGQSQEEIQQSIA